MTSSPKNSKPKTKEEQEAEEFRRHIQEQIQKIWEKSLKDFYSRSLKWTVKGLDLNEHHDKDWDLVKQAYRETLSYFYKKQWIPPGAPIKLHRLARRDAIKMWKRYPHAALAVAGFAETAQSVSGDFEYRLHIAEDWRRLGFSVHEIVAHEMVHIEQTSRGDLEANGTRIRWKGVPSDSWYDIEYKKLPWEEEAFGRMYMIARQVNLLNGRDPAARL